MFKRSENPELFDLILINYRVNTGKDTDTIEKSGIISDEVLNSIEKMNLAYGKCSSIYGIEKLVNLKRLSICGTSENEYYDKVMNIENKTQSLTEKANEIKGLREFFYKNQISNITPIYKLKNLEVLELNDQRLIKEIDLSSMPNLRKIDMRRCLNLERIKGIDKLENIKDGEKLYEIDFSGCNKLNDVENFDKFVLTLYENFNTYKEEKIVFPTTTFMFMENKYHIFKDIFKKDVYTNLPISWNEIATRVSNVSNTTRQMYIAKQYIDNVVKKYCSDENSTIQNMKSIYDWMENNISYDYVRYEELKKAKQEGKTKSSKDQESLANKLRSSITCLFDKKAICVGISNLLNLMYADIGVLTEAVSVESNPISTHPLKEPFVITDHRISAVNINNEKRYLYHEKSGGFFLLNKKQAEQIYSFTIFDEKVKSNSNNDSLILAELNKKNENLKIDD